MGREQHRTDREWIWNGHRTGSGMRMHVERKQNALCQVFPVRFLLIGTVLAHDTSFLFTRDLHPHCKDISVMCNHRISVKN